MKTYRPFSAERLFHIRRLRKARRLFKQAPLFAFEQMRQEYEDYTPEQFWEDLRRRTPKAKRSKKSPLVRYGRYSAMQKLLSDYQWTHDPQLALKAMQLRRYMTTPYRVMAEFVDCCMEYSLSPLIPMARIVKLVADLQKCRTEGEATSLVEECRRHLVIG
jgi:hypothetical protein